MLRWFRQRVVKRFGLAEAEASLNYITDRSEAQTVMSVIDNVLGYENVVGDDVEEMAANLKARQALRVNSQARHSAQIDTLRQQIAELEAANVTAAERMKKLTSIAEMFQ